MGFLCPSVLTPFGVVAKADDQTSIQNVFAIYCEQGVSLNCIYFYFIFQKLYISKPTGNSICRVTT